MTDISSYLAKIREEKGFSQQKMANMFQIPQRTWANYESGRSEPPFSFLKKLAEQGYLIPGISDGAANEAIRAVIEKTGLTKEEVEQQFSAHLQKLAKNYPLDASIDEVQKPEFKTKNQDAQTFEISTETIFPDSTGFFKFQHGKAIPLETVESDENAMVLLPLYSQAAAAGKGQLPTQLDALADYIPIVYEMLGGSNPKNCGIVRVVGDSMTDMNLFNGDFVIFDRTQIEGDGVYVISIGTDVRVKHLEYRPIERKIVISSENIKRYPNPEIISYEQAENLLHIHGKVVSWLHRNPY